MPVTHQEQATPVVLAAHQAGVVEVVALARIQAAQEGPVGEVKYVYSLGRYAKATGHQHQ